MVGFYLVDNTENPHIYKMYKYLTFSSIASVPKQMLKRLWRRYEKFVPTKSNIHIEN